ncbi:MAG TPA: hypothetical protein VLJ44_03485 [Gaiellaceae bacterium]|nr:hypothetical protein [Gaiellaceae bacterium]
MKNLKTSLALLSILALAVVAAASGALAPKGSGHGSMSGMDMTMTHSNAAATPKAVQLRIALNQLLGEHAILAIQATQRGLVGGKDFNAVAKQLDRNSVAISNAIGSVYGPAAANQFLNGKNLWRAHIKYFVDYTVATAKHDKAGQKKAVANLMVYIQTQAAFFAKATGLPRQALVNDLTAHVLQLKGQLDAFANGNYAQAYTLTNGAYEHMGMTADLLASAIAKQKHLGSTTSPAANLEVALDRLLGEHALLATWATQAGLNGDKNFPALAKQLDRNSVAISKAIGSLYGSAAAKQFLNGKNLWRAHINDFVAYTVATAKHNKAGQKKAVADLMAYIQTQAGFFAKATGLPKQALVNDLTAHVLQLKGALDDYSGKRYGATFALVNGSYDHMFMTGNVLAGGISKQKGLK